MDQRVLTQRDQLHPDALHGGVRRLGPRRRSLSQVGDVTGYADLGRRTGQRPHVPGASLVGGGGDHRQRWGPPGRGELGGQGRGLGPDRGGQLAPGHDQAHRATSARTAATIASARSATGPAAAAASPNSSASTGSVIPFRLTSMFSRAVTAAARAASAAAATSVITLRFPAGNRSSARLTRRRAVRTTSAGGRAAPARAEDMAAERAEVSRSVVRGSRYASATASKAFASASASASASSRSASASVTMRFISPASYLGPSLYRATMASSAAACAACRAAVAPPPGAETRAASWSRKAAMVSSRMPRGYPAPAQTLTVGSCAAIRRTKTLTSSGYGGSRVRYGDCSAWWSPTRTASTCSPRCPR